MEEGQDDFMQRANEEPPEALREERWLTPEAVCALIFIVSLTGIFYLYIWSGIFTLTVTIVVWVIGLLSVFVVLFLLAHIFCNYWKRRSTGRDRNIAPGGLYRRAAEGGQHVLVQRPQEIGQRRNINAAGASTSPRASLLDTTAGPSGLQNPLQLFRGEDFSRNLQLSQQRTQAESTFSQEGSSLLPSVSGESSAASRMSDVASGVSDIASTRTAERERIRTRSITKKQLQEASTSSAGQQIDPSVPGPSHLQSPERSVRHLRSKKTDSDSKKSDRQSAPKSSLSEKSTSASGGVRRREKFAARKGSVETKLDSEDSESSESERD